MDYVGKKSRPGYKMMKKKPIEKLNSGGTPGEVYKEARKLKTSGRLSKDDLDKMAASMRNKKNKGTRAGLVSRKYGGKMKKK